MLQRLKYLESQPQTSEIKTRINEISLAIVRVQQILLKEISESNIVKQPKKQTKLVSRAEKVIEKLRSEGKVKDVNIEFDSEFYESMEKIREESRRKQAQSWLDAKDILLD